MKTYRNRLWITVITLTTFLAIITGIIFAIKSGTALDGSWKEILLLLLGAFIGVYQRVIDFWFNNQERDKEIIKRADEEDDQLLKQGGTDLEEEKDEKQLLLD